MLIVPVTDQCQRRRQLLYIYSCSAIATAAMLQSLPRVVHVSSAIVTAAMLPLGDNSFEMRSLSP